MSIACICRVFLSTFCIRSTFPAVPTTPLPWPWCRSLTITVASSLILVLQSFYWRWWKLCLVCVLALKWGVWLRLLLWRVASKQVKNQKREGACTAVVLQRPWYLQLLFSRKKWHSRNRSVIKKSQNFSRLRIDWGVHWWCHPLRIWGSFAESYACWCPGAQFEVWRYTVDQHPLGTLVAEMVVKGVDEMILLRMEEILNHLGFIKPVQK